MRVGLGKVSRTLQMLVSAAAWAWVALAASAPAQETEDANPPIPGRFFKVTEPLTDDSVEAISASARAFLRNAASKRLEPVLVFEFVARENADRASDLYSCTRLADVISTEFGAARRTVAYVPSSVSGYALIPILACDEIVLGEGASLGPITREGVAVSPIARAAVETIAKRKGRDQGLLIGMLDPSLDLREVRTGDGRARFVPQADLDAFAREQQVVSQTPAWEGGARGRLTPERARALQVANLLVDRRERLISAYNLEADLAGPIGAEASRPVVIQIDGPIDSIKQGYIRRRIAQAVTEKRENLLVFRINSEGGELEAVNGVIDQILDLDPARAKTVAFVEERAMGLAALVALACDEIVLKRGARMGEIAGDEPRRNRRGPPGPGRIKPLADRAAELAALKHHPEAIARGLADPDLEIIEARDARSGAVVYATRAQIDAARGQLVAQGTAKPPGAVLSLDDQTAVVFGLATEPVRSLEEWFENHGLRAVRIDQPTWVDALVTVLNSQWMSGILLFVGLFMLILELKLPGVGLPAIISALAFMLFFWSKYLGGTADQLEVLLFIAGMIGLLLELFVFPGFGVFGLSGILLILMSIIMASHTFVWPTQEYEFQQLLWTLGRLTLTILAVGGGAVILGRYFPSMPFFRRMILVPEGAEPADGTPIPKPSLDAPGPMTFLLGERGTTTTICRPSGKALFGEYLVDVVAEGSYIEANAAVEVVDVRGQQVFVQRA